MVSGGRWSIRDALRVRPCLGTRCTRRCVHKLHGAAPRHGATSRRCDVMAPWRHGTASWPSCMASRMAPLRPTSRRCDVMAPRHDPCSFMASRMAPLRPTSRRCDVMAPRHDPALWLAVWHRYAPLHGAVTSWPSFMARTPRHSPRHPAVTKRPVTSQRYVTSSRRRQDGFSVQERRTKPRCRVVGQLFGCSVIASGCQCKGSKINRGCFLQ